MHTTGVAAVLWQAAITNIEPRKTSASSVAAIALTGPTANPRSDRISRGAGPPTCRNSDKPVSAILASPQKQEGPTLDRAGPSGRSRCDATNLSLPAEEIETSHDSCVEEEVDLWIRNI